ncbi:MAG TPA: hypothetical protein DDW52_16865 [Planctomycetaceae bacterium]|nr:hypothetical protein [Planctomycetaceae bacterium]
MNRGNVLKAARFAIVVWFCFHSVCTPAVACPFCNALASSFRDELADLDFVVLAKCQRVASLETEAPIHTFRVGEVFKTGQGDKRKGVASGDLLNAYSFQSFHVGDQVILSGVADSSEVAWSPSEALAPAAVRYVHSVVKLEKSNHKNNEQDSASKVNDQWLNLYWESLTSNDSWIRRDAYNALATVSIAQLRSWVANIKAEDVKKRIEKLDTSTSHRRFYWTVLGLCGSKPDADFVKRMIFESPKSVASDGIEQDHVGMDAAISCYLLLGGQKALDDVAKRILVSSEFGVSARFAALSALRVHAQEFDVLDKKQICTALAALLDDSSFADVVIPDLSRLEDWRHVPKLVKRFHSIEPHEQYMRLPIINYLRRCPLETAKEALIECKKVDPDTYRRAEIIFPLPPNDSDKRLTWRVGLDRSTAFKAPLSRNGLI